jgi:hypothetical protein
MIISNLQKIILYAMILVGIIYDLLIYHFLIQDKRTKESRLLYCCFLMWLRLRSATEKKALNEAEW